MNQLELHAGSCISGRRTELSDPILADMQEKIEWNLAVDHFIKRGYLTISKVVEMVNDKERGFTC